MVRRTKVRFAVVGAGHISQVAVLPAFLHADKSTELVTLVSGDAEKRRELGERYHLARTYDYQEYDQLLASGDIDAVYIALPNHLHRDYTVRAARAGIHVLCEKPMAVTADDCQAMIDAAEENHVKLMIAYRLHFEEANLRAIEIAKSGAIGDARFIQSTFCMQVKEGDIRVDREKGGGTLYDIGIYCINAARYVFQDEPIEAMAFTGNNGERRFDEVDEMTSAVLRFPGDRLASFTCSFNAASTSRYTILGTAGELRVEPAFDYQGKLCHYVTIDDRTSRKSFKARDQFAAQLIYFANCVQRNIPPEPSGTEGLNDVRIIQALYESADTGRAVPLPRLEQEQKPDISQEMHEPPLRKEPQTVNASSPSE